MYEIKQIIPNTYVFYFIKHCTSYSILYEAIARYASGEPEES